MLVMSTNIEVIDQPSGKNEQCVITLEYIVYR